MVTVTIDRPEARNAVDPDTAAALFHAFSRYDADEGLSVAVLTGAGGNFCAGFDLKALAAGPVYGLTEDRGPMGPTRMQLHKPVLAAVEGYAVAGGLELALWCDFRIAARDATFGVFNRRFGVPLVDLGTVRLPRLIGQGRALEIILTGRPVPAEEAHRIGLAERLVEQIELEDIPCRRQQNAGGPAASAPRSEDGQEVAGVSRCTALLPQLVRAASG